VKAELAKVSENELAPEPRIGDLMAMVVQGGVTPECVSVVERLCALKKEQDAQNAKRDFAAAFVDLQAEMPMIKAEKAVPNKDGSVRYHYAPYEDIMRQVNPLLKKHGFTLSFSTKVETPRVTAICTLMHRSGHERTNEYAVRIGSGPPGSSETQADGAAYSYAQRGALCDCLGVVTSGRDNDARLIGANVTDDQAEDLRQRVAATGTNEKTFLSYAGATSFENVPAERYAELVNILKKKELR
jgi:hypothetical protein